MVFGPGNPEESISLREASDTRLANLGDKGLESMGGQGGAVWLTFQQKKSRGGAESFSLSEASDTRLAKLGDKGVETMPGQRGAVWLTLQQKMSRGGADGRWLGDLAQMT